MIVTDVKIVVTVAMMDKANMVKDNQYGIPVDSKDLSKGLIWKSLMEIEDSDFDIIEEYFLNRKHE